MYQHYLYQVLLSQINISLNFPKLHTLLIGNQCFKTTTLFELHSITTQTYLSIDLESLTNIKINDSVFSNIKNIELLGNDIGILSVILRPS